MLRRARAWASAEISRLLQTEVAGARADLETSLHTRTAELAGAIEHSAREREQTIAASLDRVAGALDAIAAQLAAEARDHRAGLAAIEFVAREMALALIRPAATPSATPAAAVIGGTIEPRSLDLTIDSVAPADEGPRDGIGIQATAGAVGGAHHDGASDPITLHAGCIVEVRSRFQNRWVDGFEIVEVIERDGAERYRLARHADHMELPVLFDASDLRRFDTVDEIVIQPHDGVITIDTGGTGAPGDAHLSSEPGAPGSLR